MIDSKHINTISRKNLGTKLLGDRPERKPRRNIKSFWDIPKIMEGKPCRGMGASEDDKIIYVIK